MDAVSYVLVFLVVLVLGFYYYNQYKNYKKEQDNSTWPRKISVCPDYWSKSGDPKKPNICENRLNISSGCDDEMELDLSKYPNTSDKCQWSKKCSVPWEGIDTKCA